MCPSFRWAVAVTVLSACTNLATNLAGRPGPEAGLLRGKAPARSHGVSHVDRLTDGIAALPFDPPRTQISSVLASSDAFVDYDLGRDVHIGCAVVIADGDDRYTVWQSSDGKTFTPMWDAEPDSDRGMQPRVGRDLKGAGRWLRLKASGGDGVYAVSELAVAETCPPRWPPALALQNGTLLERAVSLKAWAFAALSVAFVLGWRRRLPEWVKLLAAAPAGVGVALAVDIADLWPPPAGTAATLIAVAVIIVAAAGVRRLVIGRRASK
jgi:hypothetical protein